MEKRFEKFTTVYNDRIDVLMDELGYSDDLMKICEMGWVVGTVARFASRLDDLEKKACDVETKFDERVAGKNRWLHEEVVIGFSSDDLLKGQVKLLKRYLEEATFVYDNSIFKFMCVPFQRESGKWWSEKQRELFTANENMFDNICNTIEMMVNSVNQMIDSTNDIHTRYESED